MTREPERNRMVDEQLVARGLADARVLAAMRRIPREAFVAPADEAKAYDDSPLQIDAKQTISQPYIVALMAEAAKLSPTDRVLEVGTGSGYAAAVFAELAAQIFSIERHSPLADTARDRVATLGYRNIFVGTGDGTLGWREHAPFEAIIVAAGSPTLPAALCEQLTIGGRLVIPVGAEEHQALLRVTRTAAERWAEEDLGPVRFVPLIGAQGWQRLA